MIGTKLGCNFQSIEQEHNKEYRSQSKAIRLTFLCFIYTTIQIIKVPKLNYFGYPYINQKSLKYLSLIYK